MTSRCQRLVDYVSAELLLDPDHELTADDEMLESRLIDSFGLVHLVAFIGSEFEITVPTEHLVVENFRSVRAIDAYLDYVQNGRGG